MKHSANQLPRSQNQARPLRLRSLPARLLLGAGLTLGLASGALAATSVTIWNEAFGNNSTGRAAAETLDDAWAASLTDGAIRPNLFSGSVTSGTHTGFLAFSDTALNAYRVDWQVGFVPDSGPDSPAPPTSTAFTPVTTGTVTVNTGTSIQGGAPKPYNADGEYRLSTGFSGAGLNGVTLDFSNSATPISEFGIFVGDLESRINNGTSGRVIVFDTAGNVLKDQQIIYTGTVLNGINYTAVEPFGSPTGPSNNDDGDWGDDTTAFISIKSDQTIGKVIFHVGDDDHTSNNNGRAEQVGLAGFQIPDKAVAASPTLTLVKNVVNTGGGSATINDFTLAYNDNGGTSGSGISGTAAVTNVTLPAGTYTLSETVAAGVTGYSQTSLVCTGTADTDPSGGLTLADGENAICTFTNTFAGSADLSVSKQLTTTGPYTSGQTISYTLVVTNSASSASDATNVVVTDMPTNLTITSVSSTNCSALPCTIPTLAKGASETITVQATAP